MVSIANSYVFVLLRLIIAGSGLGLLLPNMNVWLNAITPVAIRGKVLGGVTTAMFLGQFFSSVIIQPIAQKVNFGNIFAVAGMVMLIVAAVILGGSVVNRKA